MSARTWSWSRRVLFVAGLLLACTTATSALASHVSHPLFIYSAPASQGIARAVIPAGSTFTVVRCGAEWCEVRYRGVAGFALRSSLELPRQHVAYTGHGYVNTRGTWVPSPARTSDGLPPPGATATCWDGTFSFSQSRRGTCSHHGGVRQWLR